MVQNTFRPAALVALLFTLACSPKAGDPATQTASVDAAAPAAAGHDMHGMSTPVTIPKGALYTEADVRFMQGMIAHHAQAIYMSRLAAANGANPRLLKLAVKIDQSQMTEINQMQGWLRANGQEAPDTSSYHHVMMDGMLTEAQLKQLGDAKGTAFDKLFLEFMIMHHQGALKMVEDLKMTPGAAQDVDVSVFANDVEVVQSAEIDAMNQLLYALSATP
jgi:uncharacterized protein (DUF305 family)